MAALALTGTAPPIGCRPRSAALPLVAATVFPIQDLVRRVAGERTEVQLVLAPGLSPHAYEPRPRDIAKLADAGLVFAVGLGLDEWIQGLARSAGAGEARVFELGPLLDPMLAPPGLLRMEPVIDAHFWLDPVRVLRAVDVIVNALSSLDPEEAPSYRLRGDELKRSIHELHREIERRAGGWRRRRIVSFHGSLFYFAARYGLEVVAVVQPVPGQEPTARHVADLLSRLREPEPPALFAEPEMDRQLATAVAREAGVPLRTVDTLGGGPGTDSYEKLLRQVTAAMDEALR